MPRINVEVMLCVIISVLFNSDILSRVYVYVGVSGRPKDIISHRYI